MKFKIGDKVIHEVSGPLDWEYIDEADQDGLVLSKQSQYRM